MTARGGLVAGHGEDAPGRGGQAMCLARFIEPLPHPTAIVSIDLLLLHANQAWRDLFGAEKAPREIAALAQRAVERVGQAVVSERAVNCPGHSVPIVLRFGAR